MAEPLSAAPPAFPNVSQASVVEFYSEYASCERAISEAASVKSAAISARKRLRKRIETAGITLEQFDRVRTDLEKPVEVREAEERERQALMDFMTKPAGFQASMDMQSDDAGLRALNTAELHAIDNAGQDAARADHARSENPHPIASEAYQRWDTAFMRTRNEMGLEGAKSSLNGAASVTVTRRRRGGRPRAQIEAGHPDGPAAA